MHCHTQLEFRRRKLQAERFRNAALDKAANAPPDSPTQQAFLKIAEDHERTISNLNEANPYYKD